MSEHYSYEDLAKIHAYAVYYQEKSSKEWQRVGPHGKPLGFNSPFGEEIARTAFDTITKTMEQKTARAFLVDETAEKILKEYPETSGGISTTYQQIKPLITPDKY